MTETGITTSMSGHAGRIVSALRRSLSSASSASDHYPPPPALPVRNPDSFGHAHRRKAPPPPPVSRKSDSALTKKKVEVARSNSMDRKYFSKKELSLASNFNEVDLDEAPQPLGMSASFSSSVNDVFGSAMTATGRHNHVLSPTKEALMEHNMRIVGTAGSTSSGALSNRELDELRARCQQMEKTMRWWSDCTANWREKWSKVRAERNKYKDDYKRLAARNEALAHELAKAQNERDNSKREYDEEVARLEAALRVNHEKVKEDIRQRLEAGVQTEDYLVPTSGTRLSDNPFKMNDEKAKDIAQAALEDDLTVTSANYLVEKGPGKRVSAGPMSPSSVDSGVHQSLESHASSSVSQKTEEAQLNEEEPDRIGRFLNDAVSSLAGSEQATMLKFRLDEALKTVEAERGDKKSLLQEIEAMHIQLASLESQNDELRIARQEASRELLLARNQGQDQVRTLQLQLEDQAAKKNNLDQIIGHLREELERLQSENAEEWGRRERLESEKTIVERENRKLKIQIEELRERTKRLTSQANEQASAQMEQLQSQMQEKSKELVELRHNHNRVRKSLAEKSEEMVHWRRKSDNFDKEVKKLRSRIEELKKDLGKAEDELDKGSNNIRRLQRNNEELLSQTEGYQVQIEHLSSRLRSMPQNDILPFRRPSRLFPNHHPDPMLPPPMHLAHLPPHHQTFHPSHNQMNHNVDETLSHFSASSEESLPIFDEDDLDDEVGRVVREDDELNLSHEIETDV